MGLLCKGTDRLVMCDSQPTLTSCTPATDVAAGGVAITDLAGTGFAVGVTAFVGDAATQAWTALGTLVRVSAIRLTAVAPAKAAGTYDLMIRNPDGSVKVLVDGFIYT